MYHSQCRIHEGVSYNCFLLTNLFLCLYHRTYHVHDVDVSVGEHDGVGRVGYWHQEGEGCAQGGGDQDIQRVDVDGLSLKKDGSHKHKYLSEY